MKFRSALNLILCLVGLLPRLIRLVVWAVGKLIHLATLGVLQIQGHRTSSKYQGIIVCNGVGSNEHEFPLQIIKALRFLDEFDPRRGHSVRSKLGRILDGREEFRAQYDRGQRICQINYQYYRDWIVGEYPIEGPTQDALTLRLASLLVHVAARGRVRTRRFACRKDTPARIERLCRRQESFYYRRVAEGTTDLIDRPIDWWHESSCRPDDLSEITVLSRSPLLEALISHVLLLVRYVRELVHAEDAPAVEDSDRKKARARRWGEKDSQHVQWLEQTPLISAHLLEQAANGFRSRGMVRAAIQCYDRLHEIVRSPHSETICYVAKLLYETRQYERSERLWQQLEERKEMFKIAKSWQSAVYRQLGRFDEAKALLESSGIDAKNRGMHSQLLCLELERRDYDAADLRLREMIKNGELTPEIGDCQFWFRAVLPMIAWHRRNAEDFARDISMVSAARDRWLERHEGNVEKRWCRIIDSSESIRQPGSVPGEITLLTRIDREISDTQVDAASQLASKIAEAMQCDAFDGETGYLQGLGYGNEEVMLRRIRWNRLNPADRLEGHWCVAMVRVDRVFLDKGMIADEWIQMWIVPPSGGTETIFVPSGCLGAPSDHPEADARTAFEQIRSFPSTMTGTGNSFKY
jgi:tetratricopeptide (TPR) repeat protein